MVRTAVVVAFALVVVSCGGGRNLGTRSSGVPGGEMASVAGWDVRVVGSRAEGSTSVEAGRATYDVQLLAWFSGNDTTTFADDIAISAQASSGVMYTPTVANCAENLALASEVRPDQSIEGFVCFSVDPADRAGLLLVLTPTSGNGGPVLLNTITPNVPSADDFGPEQVVTALVAQGIRARLVISPYAAPGYLTRFSSQHVLCLDGQESTLYEYASETLREADSDTIRTDGNPKDGVIDLLYGRLMWWAKGRVIVNYDFADRTYWDALTVALGDTISRDATSFGQPPDPLPRSDLCG